MRTNLLADYIIETSIITGCTDFLNKSIFDKDINIVKKILHILALYFIKTRSNKHLPFVCVFSFNVARAIQYDLYSYVTRV